MLLFGRFFLNRPLTFLLMNWKILDKLECSFVPSQKCDGYGAAMPIIGDMLGAWSTSYTNDTNERIARKNREWQSAENEKQRQWEYDRWLEEQEYNTPVNQMERYRQAGINPFLMSNNGNVGSGQTSAPSTPAPVSSPNMPNIHPFDFSGMRSLGAYLQNQQMVDASTFNQQADAFNKYVDAAMKAYSDGKIELGDKILDTGFAQLGQFNKDTSFAKESVRLEIEKRKLDNQYQSFVNGLQEKFGRDKAHAELNLLNKEFEKVSKDIDVADMSIRLMNLEGELKRAQTDRERNEIRVQMAKIKESLSSAWNQFQQGMLAQSKSLTEDDLRQFYVKSVQLKALSDNLNYESQKAEFEGNEFWRSWLRSDKGKNSVKSQKALQHDPVMQGVRNFTGAVGDLIPNVIIPMK